MAGSFQPPPIHPINLHDYTWKQLDDPSIWQRRACGAEAVVGIQANVSRGEYDLFYAATTELVNDGKRSLQDIQRAARAAWRLLRYKEPQIAGTAAFDGQVRALLQYQVPKDEEEVDKWLDRTIRVEASDRTPMAIRDANEEERKQRNLGPSESATIYIAASVSDESTPLAGAELRILFHINHLFFDGIGFRCMIASFFRELAAQLSNPTIESPSALDWSGSVTNFREAYVKLLAPEQHLSGPEFDASMQDQLGLMARGMNNWGLVAKSNSNAGSGPSKTLWREFTKDQSQNIIKAVREKLGPGYTVTHLGQASLLLAILKMNPPGPDVPTSQIWYCSTQVNGRRYMQEPYKRYEKLYFPNSQANGFVIFEEITSYIQEGSRQDSKTKELLSRAAKQSKDGLLKAISRPHNLATATPIMEMFATIMT
ncbi:MAG: hypothetical protein Q9213_002231 [Squamulea squamosa]